MIETERKGGNVFFPFFLESSLNECQYNICAKLHKNFLVPKPECCKKSLYGTSDIVYLVTEFHGEENSNFSIKIHSQQFSSTIPFNDLSFVNKFFTESFIYAFCIHILLLMNEVCKNHILLSSQQNIVEMIELSDRTSIVVEKDTVENLHKLKKIIGKHSLNSLLNDCLLFTTDSYIEGIKKSIVSGKLSPEVALKTLEKLENLKRHVEDNLTFEM